MVCTPQSLFHMFFGAQVARAVSSSKFLTSRFCLSSCKGDGEMNNILQTVGSQKCNGKRKPLSQELEFCFVLGYSTGEQTVRGSLL